MYADNGTPAPPTPQHPYVELAVEIFSMLADATRVRIVLALGTSELSVNQLAALVERSPSSVSQHLAKLRMARIVDTRNDAQRVFYRLSNEHVIQLVTDALYQAEHAVEAIPGHHGTATPSDAPSGAEGPGA